MSNNNIRLNTYTIYLITNILNGKNYVGKHKLSKNELPESRIYMGSGKYLCMDQKKLGLENFSKEVLAICHSDVEENILERLFIAFYKSIGKAEYNKAKGGNGIDYYDFLSDEQKQEMNRKNSERLKERWKNPEYRAHMSKVHMGKQSAMKGKHYSEEIRKHMSESHKGFHVSEQAKQKLSIRFKGREIPVVQRGQISVANKGRHYYNNGIIEVKQFECPEGFVPGRIPKDRHHSEATKELIRQKRAKQVFTEESLKKRAESLKRFNATPEGKAARRKAAETYQKRRNSNINNKE